MNFILESYAIKNDVKTFGQLCLIFPNGNADVESGFSVNKSILIENFIGHSLVSQQRVLNEFKLHGSITNNILHNVSLSRRRYQQYLQNKRANETKGKKRIEEKKSF